MKKILIVDDNKLVLNLIFQHMSETFGDKVEIFKAESYREALKIFLSNNMQIHLAILDVHLPDAPDGEVIEYATQNSIPTIAITASIDQRTKDAIMKYYVVDYVTKNNSAVLNHITNSSNRILNNYDTNILIVDDSPMQLKIMSDMLEKIKLNVVIANDGEEAYTIFKNSKLHFSLVLTDYNMPNMDGMELTIKLRQEFHKGQLSIIVLTTVSDKDVASEFLKIGANDFITKPYSQTEVMTRVNSNLDILELFKKEIDNANRDFLTKAYNRRYFFETGSAILEKTKRKQRTLAIVMLDIDKFKNINDTYGHDIGDLAIKTTVKILNKAIRKTDILSRFGGEEFCVLMEEISKEELENRLEVIRKAFEINEIKTKKEEIIKFTISIGAYIGIENNLDEMVKKADENLYLSKNNGRNQVTIS